MNKNNIFKKIEENKVIDKIDIGTKFDFSKYNDKYTWKDNDFIAENMKKKNLLQFQIITLKYIEKNKIFKKI